GAVDGSGGGPGSFSTRKRIDKASPKLMEACARGTHFDQVVLHLAGPGPDGESGVHWEVVLREVRITAFKHQGTDGPEDSEAAEAGASEEIELSYDTFKITYFDIQGGSSPIEAESDPVRVDSDGDGMPDVWEIAHGLDPLV